MARELIILGIRGIPACHGGFETFAERLSLWLRDAGWSVTVYCQGSASGRREEDCWHGIRRIKIPVSSNGSVGTIEFDCKAAADAIRQPGLVLTLGYNTGFVNAWLAARGRRNVINMDGLEWKRAKYTRTQRAYLWINERLAAWAGTTLIADHPVIADHLATRVNQNKIKTIPYGADGINAADPAPLAHMGLEPQRFLTLIARAVPENSILELVRTFSSKRRGVKLALLGVYTTNDTYQAAVLSSAGSDVVFTGSIYDRKSLEALRFHSLAYLHGHQVGGTNPSLVEALGAGNPVIAHDNVFNRWVAGDAGLFFTDEDSLEAHLSTVLDDADKRHRMAEFARRRWAEAFTWEAVLQQYEDMLGQEAY